MTVKDFIAVFVNGKMILKPRKKRKRKKPKS